MSLYWNFTSAKLFGIINKTVRNGGFYVDKKENNELLMSFADWLKTQGKSDGTLNTYLGVIHSFNVFLEQEGHKLDDIQSEHVQSYIQFLERENKSPGTVEKHYSAISVFSRFLNKPNLMAGIVRKIKEKNDQIPESLNLSEQKKLIAEVITDGNLRNIAMVYTLLHTGIRVSELCELNRDDIIVNGEHAFLKVRNDNGKEERLIPLSNVVQQSLSQYLESLKSENEALFVSNINKRLTPRAVQYILKKYNVNPHKLRHTFCQSLVNNGVDLQTVSKLAGHKDINVTKRYLQEIEIDVKSAIDHTFN
jgi:integrase/recombinase XerD